MSFFFNYYYYWERTSSRIEMVGNHISRSGRHNAGINIQQLTDHEIADFYQNEMKKNQWSTIRRTEA